jgi:hypothetical protein
MADIMACWKFSTGLFGQKCPRARNKLNVKQVAAITKPGILPRFAARLDLTIGFPFRHKKGPKGISAPARLPVDPDSQFCIVDLCARTA